MRRRTVFSTPFVVILGCSQPAERTAQPTPPHSDERTVAAGSGSDDVAAREAEIRAGIGEIPRCHPSNALEPSYRGCNPPAPDARIASVQEGDVIRVEAKRDGLHFKAKMPVSAGIGKGWKGVFIEDGKPIAGSEFAIHSVEGVVVNGIMAGGAELPSKRVRVTEP